MTDLVSFNDLAEAEAAIADVGATYLRASQALLDIAEHELWRGEHEDFESYVDTRWQFSRSRAQQIMAAGRFVRQLSTHASLPAPTSEWHFRPLLKLRDKKTGEAGPTTTTLRVQAWKEVVTRAARKLVPVSHALAAEVVAERVPKRKKRDPAPFGLADLCLAFSQLADCPLTPAEARKEWGDPADWKDYARAVAWLKELEGAE